MTKNLWIVIALGVTLCAQAPAAQAFDYPFLPLGASGKNLAGSGVISSEGAPALFYNPANLCRKRHLEFYSELSLMSLFYRYKYPGLDSTSLHIVTPVPLLGVSVPIGDRLVLGLAGLAAPAAATKQTLKGVPSRQLSEDPVLLDLELGGGQRPSSLMAIGLGLRVGRSLIVGASVSRYDMYSSLKISDHETEMSLGQLNARVERVAPSLGLTARVNSWLRLGLSAEAAAETHISVASENADGGKSIRKGRKGGKEKAAVEVRWHGVRPFYEFQHEDHAQDLGDPFDLNFEAAAKPSVHDTINHILGLRLQLVPGGDLGLAYGWYPSPVGDGIMAERSESGEERAGVAFGNLAALDRNVYGVSYQQTTAFGRYACGVSHHRGKRDVSEASRGYGSYELEVSYLSCELGWNF